MASWPASGGSLSDANAQNVDLSALQSDDFSALAYQVTCYLQHGGNEYNGQLGARVSALFVILVVSSACTFFPLLATTSTRWHIPLYVYLFARYFGAGVIIATAFVHLMDPAYTEIGPDTCVGTTPGGWSSYSWVPAIALTSSIVVFLMDFYAERYVEKKFGLVHGTSENHDDAGPRKGSVDAAALRYNLDRRHSTTHAPGHQHLHSADQDQHVQRAQPGSTAHAHQGSKQSEGSDVELASVTSKEQDEAAERAFSQQIAAFLILEFGVIFHSVIIGLTLGSAGSEFSTLYPVIVFHQSFEGLGIGARLSAIQFPKRLRWLPWWLCAGYGLTTPIAIAAGLGVRTTYNSSSNVANIVSGVLDATSAGILLYTGFVELLARDFLFNPDRTDDDKQLTFMIFCVLLGAGIMALLGKWA